MKSGPAATIAAGPTADCLKVHHAVYLSVSTQEYVKPTCVLYSDRKRCPRLVAVIVQPTLIRHLCQGGSRYRIRLLYGNGGIAARPLVQHLYPGTILRLRRPVRPHRAETIGGRCTRLAAWIIRSGPTLSRSCGRSNVESATIVPDPHERGRRCTEVAPKGTPGCVLGHAGRRSIGDIENTTGRIGCSGLDHESLGLYRS